MGIKDPSFYSVNINENEYIQCALFALASYYGGVQTAMDFASTGYKRDVGDYVNDIMIGKLGEMAVKRFLKEKYSLEIDLDFDFYEDPRQIDDGDIRWIKTAEGQKISRPKLRPVDIKGTKANSKWLLISKDAFENRSYDLYIGVKIDIPESNIVDFLGGEKIDEMVASLGENSELSKKYMEILLEALKKKREELFPVKAEIMGWVGRNELIKRVAEQREKHAELKILATEYEALKEEKRKWAIGSEEARTQRRVISAKQQEIKNKMIEVGKRLDAVEFVHGESVFYPDTPHINSFSIKVDNYGVVIDKMNRDTDTLVSELTEPTREL